MCVVSMIMNEALKWPDDYWRQPVVPKIFDNIYKEAKEYDEKNGEPDCELEEKKDLLRKLAEKLGVGINFGDSHV